MPSRNNPNLPSKSKRKGKAQKRTAGKVTKNATTSSTLYPTSGPGAPLSKRRAKKVEKALNHARRRAMEAAMAKEGEVVMTDAPRNSKPKASKGDGEAEKMEVDDIS